MTERFTVLGASGFIGAHLVRRLAAEGAEVIAHGRGRPLPAGPLGHVIYAIGLTADFRARSLATMEAHVCVLAEVLRRGGFETLLYLSSTRLYRGAARAREDAALTVDPSEPEDLYDISKLAGEALCLADPRPGVRIARLSNVFGPPGPGPGMPAENFLAALIGEALATGRITLHSPAAAAKDYVDVADAAAALVEIARRGTERIYNVAAGENVAAGSIVEALAGITGAEPRYAAPPGAPAIVYSEIDTSRLAALMPSDAPWRPRSLAEALPSLVAAYRAVRARRPEPVPVFAGVQP